jgi:tetratricopeptide (TPR) repeat protein
LSHISKIGSIKTISRTSVLQYRNTTKTIPQIAAELGVTTVMEGGVQRAGDLVRINVQLIDARTDEHIWSEIYDRQLSATNIFAIQTEIANAIADALRATLSTEEKNRLQTVPTENLAALEAYFLGKQRMATRASKELKEAAEYFSQAVALDPDFALAYVGLADTYRLLNNYGGLPKDEMDAKGQTAVDRALQLDDQLGEAYASLANLRARSRDFAGAEEAFQQALRLSPNYAPAYQWYGEFLGYNGRHEEGLPLARRAVELDPLSAIINVDYAEVLETAGRFDEALAQYQKVLEFDPTFSVAATGIGDIYVYVHGRYDKAFPWFARSIALDPGRPWDPATLGFAYLDLGLPDAAEAWVRRALELGAQTAFCNIAAAFLYFHQGDEQRALKSARRVLEIYPRDDYALVLVRNDYLESGRYEKALALYEGAFPELADASDPVVNGSNYNAAIDLAFVLIAMNEPGRADLLLDRSLEQIQSLPRLGFSGYDIRDVHIHAMRGDTARALAALREAVDQGWRVDWWYFLQHDPNLSSLHGEPEYQAILGEIRADMAAQLERVRKMERKGELPLPESPERGSGVGPQ